MMKTIRRLLGRADTAPVEEIAPPSTIPPHLEAAAAAARARKDNVTNLLNAEINGVRHACRKLVKQVRADIESIDRFGGADD